jgi:hypothetical protein
VMAYGPKTYSCRMEGFIQSLYSQLRAPPAVENRFARGLCLCLVLIRLAS